MSGDLLPEPLEDVAARIARSFRRHDGFALDLVLVPTPIEAWMLWQEIERKVLTAQHLSPATPAELAAVLAPRVERRLSYIDLSACTLAADDWQRSLTILNQRRNGIVHGLFAQHIVLVTDERDEVPFATAAPDLWSIRSSTQYATAYPLETAAAMRATSALARGGELPLPTGRGEDRFRWAMNLIGATKNLVSSPGDAELRTALLARTVLGELVAEDPNERPWVEAALRHDVHVAHLLSERHLLGQADQILVDARARASALNVPDGLRGELAREHAALLERGRWHQRAKEAADAVRELAGNEPVLKAR